MERKEAPAILVLLIAIAVGCAVGLVGLQIYSLLSG